MVALEIRKVGNSLGATIPQDVAARLNVAEGDSLFLTEAPSGRRIRKAPVLKT